MLKDITIGQYFPGNSLIHRMDPRSKLIISVVFMVSIFIVNSFLGYLWVLLYLCISLWISKLPVRQVLKGLRPLLFIILFTFVLNVFFVSGETVLWQLDFFGWLRLRITKESIRTAAFLSIRLILLVLSTQILTLTTSPLSLTDAIEQLLGPLKKIKFPVHELAMMMTIALRFIPTLLQETDRIMKAQASRGADFETGSLMQRVKNMIPILVPLFVSSFRRADELALAMESRCYKGGQGRTRMKQLVFSKIDAWAALISTVSFFVMIAQGRLW